MVVFEYDSRCLATRRQVVNNVPCQWMRVVKSRYDITEITGQVAAHVRPPEVFDIYVEPYIGTPFTVRGCHHLVNYGDTEVRIYTFVAAAVDVGTQTLVDARYQWREGQLWDVERDCWVIWKTCGGGIGMTEEMKAHIANLLNTTPLPELMVKPRQGTQGTKKSKN